MLKIFDYKTCINSYLHETPTEILEAAVDFLKRNEKTRFEEADPKDQKQMIRLAIKAHILHKEDDLAKQKTTFEELDKLNRERFELFIKTGSVPASEDAFKRSLDDLDDNDGCEPTQNFSLS